MVDAAAAAAVLTWYRTYVMTFIGMCGMSGPGGQSGGGRASAYESERLSGEQAARARTPPIHNRAAAATSGTGNSAQPAKQLDRIE